MNRPSIRSWGGTTVWQVGGHRRSRDLKLLESLHCHKTLTHDGSCINGQSWAKRQSPACSVLVTRSIPPANARGGGPDGHPCRGSPICPQIAFGEQLLMGLNDDPSRQPKITGERPR